MQNTNIGAYIKPASSVFPVAASAGTVYGNAVDRQGFESCVLGTSCGAASGSPTALTVDCKLQSSPDGSTSWADVTGAAITTIVAASSGARVNVDLSQVANRYIRAVSTAGFTGGTSPAIPIHATITLGGAKLLPTS